MHNCENVHIDNCFIRTFDDSLCVKGFDCYYEGDVEKAVYEAMHRNGKAYEVFKNVLVENCTIWNDWGKCLEIGAETRAEEISGIVFKNCDIIHIQGSVLDCCNVDYADVHDITYENIRVEYDDVILPPAIQKDDIEKYQNGDLDYSPNLIEAVVAYHEEYSAGGSRRGKNRDITFKNIYITADRHIPKMYFCGYDEAHKIENVAISDIYLNGKRIENENEIKMTFGEYAENITFENKKIK